MKSKVTVVIPTINRGSLARAVASVNDQSFRDYEIIIVDDSQEQLVESENFQVLKTGGLAGVSKARNLGMSHVGTEFIALLDDDDFWHKEYLARQISNFDRLQIDFGLTGAIVNGRLRPKKPLEIGTNPFEFLYGHPHLLRSNVYLPTSTYMFRTKITETLVFDEKISDRENLKFVWETFNMKYKVFQDPQCVVTIDYSKGNSLSRIDLAQEIEWSRYLKTFKERWSQNFIIESARNFIRYGDHKSANIMIGMINPREKIILRSILKLLAL